MDDTTEKTLWCGNLSPNITEDLLFELFLQAGPLEKVNLPKEKDGKVRNYAFIIFKHAISVRYAIDLLNGVNIHGRPLRLKPRSLSTDSPPTNRVQANYDHANDSNDQRGRNPTRPERVHRTNSFSDSTNSFSHTPRSRHAEIWSNPYLFCDPNRQNLMQRAGLAQKMMMRGNAFHPYVPQMRNYPYWQ